MHPRIVSSCVAVLASWMVASAAWAAAFNPKAPEIEAVVTDDDFLVLQLPDGTLPETVTFKSGGLEFDKRTMSQFPGAFQWESPSRLAVDLKHVLYGTGIEPKQLDEQQMWVWGQLEEGTALLQPIEPQ